MEKSIIFKNIDQVSKQRNFFIVLLSLISFVCAGLVIKLITTQERVILVPGLNQEVWIANDGVSSSYLEEAASMYLPLLLDLTADGIDWKKEKLFTHVSSSDPKYMKSLNEYFARTKEKYKQFGLSTHFAVKSFEVDKKNMVVKASGQLVSRYGERGFQSIPAVYGIAFEWVSGKLKLTEFMKLSKEGELDNEKLNEDGNRDEK